MRVAAPVTRPSAAVPGIAVETRPRDNSASIEIAPGPRTMIQPSRTAQYRCSGDGPSGPCSAQASNRSGSATMREQRPIMSSVGHRVAITAPSGDATTRSTVGAIAPPRDIVIGACIAMLTTVSIRNALASQKRIARSSQAPRSGAQSLEQRQGRVDRRGAKSKRRAYAPSRLDSWDRPPKSVARVHVRFAEPDDSLQPADESRDQAARKYS